MSRETEILLEERGEAIRRGDYGKFVEKDKALRKGKKRDRRDNIIHSIRNELDVREKWLGIRRPRSDYNPTP